MKIFPITPIGRAILAHNARKPAGIQSVFHKCDKIKLIKTGVAPVLVPAPAWHTLCVRL